MYPADACRLNSGHDFVWLRLGDRIWQGAFFYRGPWYRATRWPLPGLHDVNIVAHPTRDPRIVLDHIRGGVEEFNKLGDLAASQFELSPDPACTSNGGDLLRAKGADRWLEKLHGLGLYKSAEARDFTVKQLTDGVFTASARGIELLAHDKQQPPINRERKRSTLSADQKRELIISELSHHHGYDESGGCTNSRPIVCRGLARDSKGELTRNDVSRFFKSEFGGYREYLACCRDSWKLAQRIKSLRDEVPAFDPRGRR